MLSSGDKIGPYTIRERAGQGGMAIVYQAWHEGLHRLEALKIPRGAEQNASDSAYIQRLLAEARVAAGLHHPNIVAIHGVSEPHAPIPFFAMDWVQGRDLAQILAQKRRFSLEETTGILEQVASALDYAHARGVVHRDIKPANILLSEEGGALVPKVVDFGISRAAEDDDSGGETKLTRSGMIVGTPEYMSPEQAGSGERVDFRTDIYSLGVVAYEMLCGGPPFTAGSGVSRLSILISHVRDAAPLWEKCPGFPPQTGAVILRALSKMPEDRPASCAEFVAALRATGEQPHAFFTLPAIESAAERTPFDESRFERDEAATIFERPISLSDTPPPGPPPTLAPPAKPVETAHDMPRESPTSGTHSLRARLLEAAAQNASPTPLPDAPPQPSPQTERETTPADFVAPASSAAPSSLEGWKKSAPRAVSRTALWAGISGVVMGGVLVLVLLGGRSGLPTPSSVPTPRAGSGLESAVALPLPTQPKNVSSNPAPQSRIPAPVRVAPPIAVAPAVSPPRLRFATIIRTAVLPYATLTRRSPRRALGSSFVAQRGRNGQRQTTVQISYRGAQEIQRRPLAQRITRAPQPEIVVIGTRVRAAPSRVESPPAAPPRVRLARPTFSRPTSARPTFRAVSRRTRIQSAPSKLALVAKRRPVAAQRRVVREAPLPP